MKGIISPGHYNLEMDQTDGSSQESKLPHSNGRANMKNLVASECPIAQGSFELFSTAWTMKSFPHYPEMDRAGNLSQESKLAHFD